MNNLDWFQARTLARGGTAVRRDAWRKWLTFESYVWLITQPAWLEQEYDRRVTQQWDFGADEFLAHDWTDETWPDGPQPPDPPDPPEPPEPPRPPEPPGDDGGDDGGGGDPPNPPDPPGDGGGGGTGGNGGGGGTDGGGGGWPPGGGGGGGPQPPVPPKPPKPPKPPQPDVPTISVEVTADVDPDGPACFIQPPQTCTVYVNVSIAGGPAGVGTLRVSGVGTPSIQLGTAHPGYSGGFEFKNVPVNPGGTITYTADYGAPGNAPLTHYTGTGSFKFPPLCLVFSATWYGTMTEDKSCQHDGPSGDTEDGYTYAASYSVNGQYAVNPEDGSGKSAQQTPVDVNEGTPHIHWTNDTRPDGTHTEGDIDLYPPGSVTVDVSNGGVPANGYAVDKWYVTRNGIETADQTGGNTFVVTHVTSAVAVRVTFKVIPQSFDRSGPIPSQLVTTGSPLEPSGPNKGNAISTQHASTSDLHVTFDGATGLYSIVASWKLSNSLGTLNNGGTYSFTGTAGQNIQVARLQSDSSSGSYMEINLTNNGTALTGSVTLHSTWNTQSPPGTVVYSGEAISTHPVTLQ